jgi:CheY-like chemotaxis protein
MTQYSKPVILIVEDEHLIRMLAVEAFLDEGFFVLEAECAAEAILVSDRNAQVQVLFTDVNMPGEMNGIDLAEYLLGLTPKLHVIITSGLPVLRPVDHLPALFMPKPYHTADVCTAAWRLLAA